MKYLSKVLLATITIFGFYACSGDDDNNSNHQTRTELHKKWIVQITSDKPTGTVKTLSFELDDIESIEFTDDGIFVIVGTEGEVTTGTYAINGSILDLGETGTISINELNESSFRFTFEVSENTLNLFATPADEIATNPSNEAFFQYWTVQNLEEYNATAQDPEAQYSELNMLFTRYGTFVVDGTTLNGNPYTGLFRWKWKNEEQNKFCHSLGENEEFDCDDDFFEINSLSTSQLVFTETPNNVEDEFQYTFVPAN